MYNILIKTLEYKTNFMQTLLKKDECLEKYIYSENSSIDEPFMSLVSCQFIFIPSNFVLLPSLFHDKIPLSVFGYI